jgi:hypothetical protein
MISIKISLLSAPIIFLIKNHLNASSNLKVYEEKQQQKKFVQTFLQN